MGIELLRGANGRVPELRLGDMQRLPALSQNNAQFPPEVLELDAFQACLFSRPAECFINPLVASFRFGIPEHIRASWQFWHFLNSSHSTTGKSN